MDQREGLPQNKPEGLLTTLKNRLFGRGEDSVKTVVKHDDVNSTVITTAPDREGAISHTFLNVDKGIDASSLGQPLNPPSTQIVGEHRGLDVTKDSQGRVRLTSQLKPLDGPRKQ